MVHPSIVEARIGELRFRVSRWFRAEVNELQHILMENEKIIVLACGRYFGSFAMLVATDQRLLLIDKRVFFMNIEDTRYDMISEIDFNSQIYSATVTVHTINKTHKFTSIKHKSELRKLTNYVQQRVMEFRNQQTAQSVSAPSATVNIPQPQTIPRLPAAMIPEPFRPVVDYGFSPAVSDDPIKAVVEHSPDLAKIVGSAAVQATHDHHWHHRPFHPYVQGSLMTRRPVGGNQPYQY